MLKKVATISVVIAALATIMPGQALAQLDDRLDRDMRQPVVPIQVTQGIVLGPLTLTGNVLTAPFGATNGILILTPNGLSQTVLLTPQTLIVTPSFSMRGISFWFRPGDVVTIRGVHLQDGRIVAEEIRVTR